MIGIKTTATAIIDFLARPLTRMWAFTLSVMAVYVALKYGLGGVILQMKYMIPELFTLSLLLSLVEKDKWRTALEWVFIILLGLLSTVEVWLSNHFNLPLSYQAIQLLMETNPRESSEFFHGFVLQSYTLRYLITFLLGLAVAAVLYLIRAKGTLQPLFRKLAQYPRCTMVAKVVLIVAVGTFYYVRTGWLSMQPRYWYSMTSTSVSEFEKRFTEGEQAGGCGACTPLSRVMHGIRLYELTSKQCDELVKVSARTRIEGCDYKASNIVLMIGESYIKRHAQIYGYDKPTTPRMMAEMEKGNLVAFSDAVTPYTLTSNVMKEMLSMHSVDQEGSWSSVPMMPQLFRLAKYRVSLLSNQFTRFNSEIWNSTGGFFLTNPKVTRIILDYHNDQHYRFDEGLLPELDAQMRKQAERNLILFHVRGQHVEFMYGYPEDRPHFTIKDYAHRKGLNQEQKQEIADYDNSTLYQDSIMGALIDRFRDKDMVMVFVSDHGENVYDDGKTLGRIHNDYSRPMLESEYEVPMWIWYSDKYKALHPDMVEKIKHAANRPFETDDMPHLLLELAGIRCTYFNPSRSLINDKYNAKRPRLVGAEKRNYDELMRGK